MSTAEDRSFCPCCRIPAYQAEFICLFPVDCISHELELMPMSVLTYLKVSSRLPELMRPTQHWPFMAAEITEAWCQRLRKVNYMVSL